MKLDRTKHNKFVTGAVYGNTTSGDITPSSSTASAVGGGGTTVIIQGGGGSQEPVELGLGDLTNVGTWANEVAAEDRFMVQVANGNQWVAKPISDIVNGDSDLTNYAKISYVDEKLADKVDNAFFLRVFGIIGENDEEIPVNDISSTIKSIQVKFGLWTNEFLSAIGLNPTDGEITAISLSSLNDVSLNQQLINGQALVWNGNFWTNQSIESGLDEDSLQNYLHTNKYVTQDYVAEQLQSYATVGELNQFKIETSESLDNLQSEINDLSDKKLDKAFFKALFGLMDDDVEIEPNTKEIPESASIKAKFGLWTEEYLSALGMNPANGDVALTLASLSDVLFVNLAKGQSIVWDGSKWINQLIESGLNESALAEYLTKNNYATTSDLDARIDALVNGAPAAYDTLKEIADVLAGNVNSISDILTALGNKADKATTLGGYGITDAYTITQIDSIVNGLSGNISTLQGYFTDGVANSALKLSDNGNYTAWGQTFFTNGKPKLVSGALTDVTDITSSGTITTNKIVIGNGTIEWDEDNEGFKIVGGLYTESYLSAKGADMNDGSSSVGGLIEQLWKIGDLGKTFNTDANDTFNAYVINAIHNRVSVLEGKATNVSFTQSLTSGTQIGTITIDGASKNIYAPTIPISDINKGVTAYDWGNHASVGYLTSASSLAWGKITGTPNTLSGYGITDWHTGLGNYNVNARFDAGYYGVRNGSNVPSHAGYGSLLVMPYRKMSGNTTPDFATQIFLPNGDESGYPNDMFFRTSLGSSWNAWQRVLTDNNYTSYIYSKSTIDTKLSGYLPLSGGTITISAYIGMILKHSASSAYPLLWFANGGGNLGAIGVDTNKNIVFDNGTNAYTLIHSGNIGSQSVDNADKVDGYHVKASNTPFDGIPIVRSDGVMEIGKYIDFHNDNTSGNDYDCRLDIQGGNGNVVHLPSTSGILALLTSNVASATKLQTARSIWGQSFDGTGNISGDLHLNTSKIYWWGDAANYCIESVQRENSSPYLKIAHYGGISFNTAGIERMFIAGSGNVGIGTSTDNGYKLDVNGVINTNSRIYTPYVFMGKDREGIYIADNVISWHNASNVYVKSIIEFTGGLLKLVQPTTINSTLDVNSTLHASGAVTFDNTLSVASTSQLMGNVGIGVAPDNNKLYVYGVIRSAAYNAKGNNNASFIFDKLGSHYTGIGANGVADTIYFGACGEIGAWVTDYYQKWHFNGTIYGKVGIWSDGYVSAKGQNTSSDMRLKNVLNEVVLGVKDIANAPSMRFSWKNSGGVDVGSSAQYWQKLLPDAVKERDGMLEMQYANIALLSAIALAKNVETHEERIARLERENKELRNEINVMKGCIYE